MAGEKTVEPKWVSPKEAASAAGVDERTVRRWCQKGKVEAKLTPSGKNWRIRLDEDGFPVRR